jgi:hypothetical protein
MLGRVSHRKVVIAAAVIWYGGGMSLVLKGGYLLRDAYEMNPEGLGAPLALFGGLVAGLVKAFSIFGRSCRKNIARIAALEAPRLWQCFRPGFLLFLAVIIPTGAAMSRLAEGNYAALCAVGALDLSIAAALLGSSRVFWRRRELSSA